MTAKADTNLREALDCRFCRTTCNGGERPCASLVAAKDCPWMSRSDWDAIDAALASEPVAGADQRSSDDESGCPRKCGEATDSGGSGNDRNSEDTMQGDRPAAVVKVPSSERSASEPVAGTVEPPTVRETCIDCGKCEACDEDCPNFIDPPAPAGREAIAKLIASKFDCEKDCQSAPKGCGCALDAADAILALGIPSVSAARNSSEVVPAQTIEPEPDADGCSLPPQALVTTASAPEGEPTQRIENLIAIWSMRPAPGSESGQAWEAGARQGWKWAKQFATTPAPGAADRAEWQDIETAPTDGTDILLWWKWCKTAAIGCWRFDLDDSSIVKVKGKRTITEGWMCEGDACLPLNQEDCTHWMPLPAGPSLPRADRAGGAT